MAVSRRALPRSFRPSRRDSPLSRLFSRPPDSSHAQRPPPARPRALPRPAPDGPCGPLSAPFPCSCRSRRPPAPRGTGRRWSRHRMPRARGEQGACCCPGSCGNQMPRAHGGQGHCERQTAVGPSAFPRTNAAVPAGKDAPVEGESPLRGQRSVSLAPGHIMAWPPPAHAGKRVPCRRGLPGRGLSHTPAHAGTAHSGHHGAGGQYPHAVTHAPVRRRVRSPQRYRRLLPAGRTSPAQQRGAARTCLSRSPRRKDGRGYGPPVPPWNGCCAL